MGRSVAFAAAGQGREVLRRRPAARRYRGFATVARLLISWAKRADKQGDNKNAEQEKDRAPAREPAAITVREAAQNALACAGSAQE
jgi:hypothetical protein